MAKSALKSIGDDVFVYLGNYREEMRIKIKKLKEDAEGRKEQDGHKGISLTIEQWEQLCMEKDEISEHLSLVQDRGEESKRAWRLSPNRFYPT
ncbi:uncharacterized protein [Argopecten irradians]|uniref:uncharacterized protein n=1 Tax=Argopecten irradians TaxID=31199 RepID=UPI00371C3542